MWNNSAQDLRDWQEKQPQQDCPWNDDQQQQQPLNSLAPNDNELLSITQNAPQVVFFPSRTLPVNIKLVVGSWWKGEQSNEFRNLSNIPQGDVQFQEDSSLSSQFSWCNMTRQEEEEELSTGSFKQEWEGKVNY